MEKKGMGISARRVRAAQCVAGAGGAMSKSSRLRGSGASRAHSAPRSQYPLQLRYEARLVSACCGGGGGLLSTVLAPTVLGRQLPGLFCPEN